MNELMNTTLTMNHVQLCELINKLRLEEGNKKELTRDNLYKKIKHEVNTLQEMDLKNSLVNFYESTYINSRGKEYATYEMNRDAILQIAASESVFVRAKIIEYINALETKISQQQHLLIIQEQQFQLKEKDDQIKRLESLVGIRAKEKFDFVNYIKRHLDIAKIEENKADYYAIRDMLFIEMKVSKWEDIAYNREAVKLLKEICNDFSPRPKRRTRGLF